MSDTSTVWVPALGRGDWVMQGTALQTGNDLQTAILISIFTDRIANTDDVIPDGSNDPRGWWGDAGEPYPIGSRLWLLSRAKQTAATAALAIDYVTEALQWLIDDGAVASFTIDAQWMAAGQLGVSVIAFRQDGSTVALNFASVWLGIN